ncbi:hypothetical protein CONPUDRAFT_159876 [Coniophora puteana RWD-64-598 SS2]|uniref:Uncharacterized protein n=1 Tax=Coniophora puteana (strain RWD-64-598) TaxID=741705 RepID=R7SFD9_CONPW|nr:uncharacterized protein CONPUDRAFT_159876 [Coniophora puteana RWD-64-598 SS2]EIW74590.1 hypothetical protein CONPUDRAFT_159876 [Coniophora puteana RWD-64-598 SS2]
MADLPYRRLLHQMLESTDSHVSNSSTTNTPRGKDRPRKRPHPIAGQFTFVPPIVVYSTPPEALEPNAVEPLSSSKKRKISHCNASKGSPASPAPFRCFIPPVSPGSPDLEAERQRRIDYPLDPQTPSTASNNTPAITCTSSPSISLDPTPQDPSNLISAHLPGPIGRFKHLSKEEKMQVLSSLCVIGGINPLDIPPPPVSEKVPSTSTYPTGLLQEKSELLFVVIRADISGEVPSPEISEDMRPAQVIRDVTDRLIYMAGAEQPEKRIQEDFQRILAVREEMDRIFYEEFQSNVGEPH